MVLNKRHERMVTLLSKNSPPDTSREKFMDAKLYEAAKKGDVDSFIDALVKVSQANNSLSLRTISEQRTHSKNTCLHVAASHGNKYLTARAGHIGVVKILVRFKNYDEQMYSAKECDTTESSPRSKEWVKNSVGNTSMHEACLTNMVDVVTTTLSNMTLDAKKRFISESKNGKLLINAAIKRKSTVMLQEITRNIPSQIHATDKIGQTPLSCAVSTAENGKDRVVSFILKTKDLGFLINKTDEDGNTPLHLAVIKWHPKVVSCLTWDRRVNLNLVNECGLTALDAAEESMESITTFQQRLTWSALSLLVLKDLGIRITVTEKSEQYKKDYSKDRCHHGFCYSHMGATGDITLVMNGLMFALPRLGLSLTTMSIAFMAGVSLVVVNLTWLANFVLIFGIICIASVLALFIPLVFSYSSTSKVLRYITYYPFQLLVLVSASRSSDDQHIKED
uniref:Uncharacterized protein n=1 Tax=Tanacetum cinerariifolium TaxID=118510 RepID=A0A6L2L5A7_TANCI|nr:hypothetical protein [Tanacetum cinerariifolium]